MKKIITIFEMRHAKLSFILLFSFFSAYNASSQAFNPHSKDALKRMIKCFNSELIDQASVIADSCVNDPDLLNDSKFWFYRGLIFKEMFKKHEKGNTKSPSRDKAALSFKKALEIEKDADIIVDIKKNIKYIAATYHNDAVKLLQDKNSNVSLSIYAYDKYIELMKLTDEKFNVKEKESEFLNALGSVYARMFENEKDIHADSYYELAKNCYQKVLAYDSSQTSAKYNLVVLETNFKTKQERLLKDESDKKDQVILSLNAVKKLAEAKLTETQLEEESKKKELIILKNEQEKKELEAKAEQERKDAVAQKEKQTQRTVLWLVVSGLFVAIVFAGNIYRNARQKEKLNKELAKLSFVVSKSTNTVLIFNANMELEWVNNTFLNIYGMSMEDYKKENGKTLYDVSGHPDINKLIQECITKKTGMSYESVTDTKNMGNRWFQSMLSPIFDESGKLQNMMIIDSDITELKYIEEEIRQKNKDITDSIHYASRIQQSILPPREKFKDLLPESFIFHRSKDIVSGDFYWLGATENNSKVVVAAVDCTGHGVPGALLTVIGNDLLNHIINEKGISNPKEILQEMNLGIIHRFALTDEDDSREGMDMSIFTLDRKGKDTLLQYSGAHNPLYYIRDNQLIEFTPIRYNIGSIPLEERDTIICHNLEIKANDMVYIFSDGYADQLSGETGKKFMKGKFKQLLLDIHKRPLAEQKSVLEKAHTEWKGETFQTDDMLVMGFRF
jgi:PAS domain S-box-containing protein